jgi:hypothetical protein
MYTSFGTSDIRSGEVIHLKEGTHLLPSNSGIINLFIDPFIDCFSSSRLAAETIDDSEVKLEQEHTVQFEKGKQLVVYPNPTRDHIYVSINADEDAEAILYLYDLSGKLLQKESKNINQGVTSFGLSMHGINAGTYILRASSQNNNYGYVRIIVQ